MDDAAAVIGGPGYFDWKGKTWRFAPCDTVAVIKGFQSWLVGDIRAELRRQRNDGSLSAEEYAAECAGLRDDIAAKKYHLGGSVYRNALQQQAGQMQLMLLMVRQFHPDAPASLIEEIWAREEDILRVSAAMGFFDDPNSKGPAAK